MNRREMIKAYNALTDPGRISFLAHLSWELTVLARGTYAVGSEKVNEPVRLRTFNECQHQVTQHLRHLLNDERARYPEDVFVEIVCESATELGFEARLGELLAEAVKDCSPISAGPRARGRVA